MSIETTTIHTAPKEIEARAASFSASSCSTRYTLSDSASTFSPSHTLTVDARGTCAIRLPFPSRQTEITINHDDGRPAYVSTRDRLWSGNSVLSHAKRGALIRTDYFFGPGRDPVLRLLASPGVRAAEVKVTGQWTSRYARFTMPAGGEYEWVYSKEKQDGQKVKLIILRSMTDSKANGAGKEFHMDRRLAQLVRSDETRTPGTSKFRAGNGGHLQIDDAALQDTDLDESVVVATCLVMLKREIDRCRTVQCMVMMGAAGGS
ncbi:uncharacterized protein N7459_008916 [Penicillium hispanicum]|uniref:uncharacterized protein n=1 Tax=Penicillium hispanicum TaxID=1080232 RepID=UPI002541A2D6|nr:uncharacterized protein N7459_008916 [Penicillium hispanicum]KAJ5569486.1 hypothetical protein N7459_008916 [Penicillium hispanicum]